jgi:hypothetical protein
MLRHTYVTTMLGAGVDLRDVQIAARHADPGRRCGTTEPVTSSTAAVDHPQPGGLTWPRRSQRRARS